MGPLLAIILPLMFGGIRQGLIEDVADLMFIDDTTDTTEGKVVGKMASEKEQFDAWKMPMKEAFDKCVKDPEKENSAADCINGLDYVTSVFNVTNPEGVIMGQMPAMQEIGPIFMKKYIDKVNIDEDKWNMHGVAKFQHAVTFELDEDKCGKDLKTCKDLLQAKVVVPNPVYHAVAALGAEAVLAAIVAVGATAQMLPEGSDIGAVLPSLFGLTDAAHSAAFVHLFLLEPDMNKKLAGVGGFLVTGQTAVAGLQQDPPDMSGTCVLGTEVLDALTCATALQKLMETIPPAWVGTMTALAPLYGTGAAAPVFIMVTVAQVLGFEDTFVEPLTQTPDLSFAGAISRGPPFSDPPNVYREGQMAKKFKDKGTGWNTKYGGMEQMCVWDADCVLTSPYPNSCTPSDTCVPADFKSYYGASLPGKLWGEPGGFDFLKKGTKVPAFNDGLVVTMILGDEESMSIKTGEQAGNELKYMTLKLAHFPERTENCDGATSDTPGLDCNGPKHTISVAPLQDGAPVYITLPYFDTKHQFAADPSQKSIKYGPNAYDPADKVEINKCTGHEWCKDRDYSIALKYEPNAGLMFGYNSGSQLAVRIGSMPSMLYPKMADATIPIYTMTDTVVAPDKMMGDLYALQSAPESLSGLIGLFIILGSLFMFIGLLCLIIICCRQRKYAKAV